MVSFGVIAEGPTDQKVIKNILLGLLGNDEQEPDVNNIQPPYDETTKNSQSLWGGWELIFKALQNGEHIKTMQFNDYLIIQIDTDVSEHPKFGVAWREGERERTVPELIFHVIEKLKSIMGEDFCREYTDQVFFAIAVHEIECWLMPLYYNDKRTAKTTGCLEAINSELRKQKKPTLSKSNGEKIVQSYESASKNYTKRKDLMKVYEKNESLKLFVDQLKKQFEVPAE